MQDPLIEFVLDYWSLKANDFDVSTGSIIRSGGNYVFELQKPERWRRTPDYIELGYVGIGGKREAGESPRMCIEREIAEELVQAPRLIGANATAIVEDGTVVDTKSLNCEPNPLLVIRKARSEAARSEYTIVFVFSAELSGPPRSGDVEGGVVFVPVGVLSKLQLMGNTAVEFKQMGIRIETSRELPLDAKFVPFGTARAVVENVEELSL